MRLLIIEDDPVFARTLIRALDRLGHTAVSAATPDAALAALAGACFDAAVLDMRLGEHSGLALIEPLRAVDPALRVLVLTGYASIVTAISAIKRGAFNYLPKPATARQILAALEADTPVGPTEADTAPSLARIQWEHIQQALIDHDDNISATARALGMHRRTLQRRLAKKPARE